MALAVTAVASAAAPSTAGPSSVRISPSQYRQSIADIFGRSIAITGRFEPETRTQGLLAIGAARVSVTDSGLERYDELARGIATQVVDAEHRATLVPCSPHSAQGSDDECARTFLTSVGRLLYRRPLTEEEVQDEVRAAGETANKAHDFYAGLSAVLADMLISPNFLYRYEFVEPDPAHAGQVRLDAYSKASALSFFLWNTTPDKILLDAAQSGQLQTTQGLRRQVDRLVSSPRVEQGVRAFFSDMLGFSDFETLSKDPSFFPRYTLPVKDQSQEQTLRTIVDELVTRHGDYRDLFTTPHTFLTTSLAALYRVPLADTTDNGQPDHWFPYSYPPGDLRAGILSEASFTALYSPSGRTSPTGRGKALRETILCEAVPPPPGNVDFKFIEDTSNPEFKTARQRLTAHRSQPMCAGCHKLTDPIGLALENFDSSGGYRTTENGVPIDATGELNGHQFVGSQGLAKAVHDDPATTSCVATKAFAFETGYLPAVSDPQWRQIMDKFAASHYNFLELMRQIALSDLTYRVPSSALSAANH